MWLTWVSHEKVHMKFTRIELIRETHMKKFTWVSREMSFHMKFIWIAREFHVKFTWISHENTSHQFHVKSSHQFHVSQFHVKLTWFSCEIHVRFTWISREARFTWNSCEPNLPVYTLSLLNNVDVPSKEPYEDICIIILLIKKEWSWLWQTKDW